MATKRTVYLLAAAGCLLASLGVWRFVSAGVSAITPARSDPSTLNPLVQALFAHDSPEAQSIREALRNPPPAPMETPIFCHLLLAYRLGALPLANLPSGRDIVNVLTDQPLAKSRFGQSVLFQTRNGVRYKLISQDGPSGQQGESHRDLCLATFAEVGLPLATSMHAGGRSFTLRDLLADSVAGFDMHEPEIAWTAIAYCLYLPPHRGWSNRDGERYTFDDLAAELARRPLNQASCGGAHLLMAITFLLRVDRQQHVLSPPMQELLVQRLRDRARAAIASQAAEGSWTVGWEQQSLVHPIVFNTRFYKLLITGHLLEWLEYLPSDLQPPASVYRRAAHWLCDALQDDKSGPFQAQEFCPWTHAICAVRNLLM